jgi:hypothetical protein
MARSVGTIPKRKKGPPTAPYEGEIGGVSFEPSGIGPKVALTQEVCQGSDGPRVVARAVDFETQNNLVLGLRPNC